MKHKINTGIGHLVHQYQKQGIHFNLTAVAEQFKFVSQSVSQSVSVSCQNSGVGGSHGFLLPSFSHHLNEVQRSKPSHALQPPKQGTSLPPSSSLTLDSSSILSNLY